MKIEKLILKQYKRLMLSNMRSFEWTPQSRIMLLLGSNGSGKSSLMEELTPCPAHHSAFEKGGLKEFHCLHKNHRYVLRSEYNGGSGHHSFVRDGVEELNPGATFAVQKELVWTIFGLDRATHEVLIGLMPFTGMPTAKRREWLTRLFPHDMGYVFSQYNTVTTHKRDAQALIRHNAKRLSNENIDLPDDAEMAKYREKVKSLTERLQTLYRERGTANTTGGQVIDFETHYQTLRSKVKSQLQGQPNPTCLQGLSSREEAVAQVRVSTERVQVVNDALERTALELDTLNKQRSPDDNFGSPEQIQALTQEKDQLLAYIQVREASLSAYTGLIPIVAHDTYQHSVGLLEELLTSWTELITSFPNNPDDYFSHQAGTEAREQYTQNKNRLHMLHDRHNTATQRLARLRGCDDVVCPECTHSFKPGINPTDITGLESVCAQLHEQIQTVEQEQERLKGYIEAFDDYMTYVNRFRVLVRQYDLYKPVWNLAVERRIMFTEPRKYLTDVITWGNHQRAYIERTEALTRVTQIEEQFKRFSSFDKDKAVYLAERQTTLEAQTDALYQERGELGQQVTAIKSAIREVDQYEQGLKNLERELSQFMVSVANQIQNLVHQGYDEEIRHTSSQLADIQATLHRSELREHTLRDIEREHKEAVDWHTDLGLLEKALSPKDGLIGRYLMGFMQNIVKLMNAVVDEVWTYPLEVMPSKVEKDELDYNFPLKVNNGAVIAPDISRGSSSQRDIVNFAWKLIVMKFLGFEDYPLFLDEFGNTFDEQHRQNLIPFLNRLIELNQVSQIFYISHFSSSHGAFNHAEIVVLDTTNITVPSVYNQTVKVA